jgi:hypothetical protein
MRALSAVAVLAILGVSGAVIGVQMAAPDTATSARTTPAGTDRSTAAPVVRTPRGPVRLTVRTPAGTTLANTVIGRLDPVRAGAGYRPVDPPEWNQAVWVRYRPFVPPTDTSRGTSYIYGHACHHHVCAFTDLARVRPGASITVTSGGHATTYRVVRASAGFPKHGPGSLADRTGAITNRSIAHRIVLITCAYERGDVSLDNFVVVARRR